MSSRITRSSARQAANQTAAPTPADPSNASAASDSTNNPNPALPATTPSSRKRKADKSSSPAVPASQPGSAGRRSKRQKIPAAGAPAATPSASVKSKKKGKAPDVMDSQEYVGDELGDGQGADGSSSGMFGARNPSEQTPRSGSSSRKSSRSKRQPTGAQGITSSLLNQYLANTWPESATPSASSSTRKSKRHSNPSDQDTKIGRAHV